MSAFKGIRIESGTKYVTPAGFTAIRNGVKRRGEETGAPRQRKPGWLRVRVPDGPGFRAVREIVREHRYNKAASRSRSCGTPETSSTYSGV